MFIREFLFLSRITRVRVLWDAVCDPCEEQSPELASALAISRRSVRGRKNNRKKSDGGAAYGPPKVRLALAFLTGGARCLRRLYTSEERRKRRGGEPREDARVRVRQPR